MKQEALNLWLSALESGNYRQIPFPMHAGDGFDVLGVLVEAYRLKFGGEWTPEVCRCKDLESGFQPCLSFLNCSHLPPNQVASWSGVRCSCKSDSHKPSCEVSVLLGIIDLPFIEVAKRLRKMASPL